MRADVDAYVLGHAARLRHEHAGRLGGDAGVRPLPTGVNDGEALRRREDHGNAIGKAEHGGHARRRAHDGVGPFPDLGPHAFELVRAGRAHHGGVIPMHLIGHQQPLEGARAPERRKRATAVLLNAGDVVPHVGPQIQGGERRAGNATRTLREPKPHALVMRRNKRHAINLYTPTSIPFPLPVPKKPVPTRGTFELYPVKSVPLTGPNILAAPFSCESCEAIKLEASSSANNVNARRGPAFA